jgi:hypothetical protein
MNTATNPTSNRLFPNWTPHGWSLHRELHLLRQAGMDAEQVPGAATQVAADKLKGPGAEFVIAAGRQGEPGRTGRA